MSSVIGNNLRLSVFGESHGAAIGCVLEGLPAGLQLNMEAVQAALTRRAPGRDDTASSRREADEAKLLSGVKDGVTTGAPLVMMIENTDSNSAPYTSLKAIPRPGHADYPAYVKSHGHADLRGGGQNSGRLTAPMVFAGAIAAQYLEERGMTVAAHIQQIGDIFDTPLDPVAPDMNALLQCRSKALCVLDDTAAQAMRKKILQIKSEGNSIGGAIECVATGLPVGCGGALFDSLEGALSRFLFAIPAVKGVQFGRGFGFARATGAEVSDGYTVRDGRVTLAHNNNGGLLGGMTSGAPLLFSVAIKPTPSIALPQQSVNLQTMENETLRVQGRHDPCIVPRAVPVIEAATAWVLLDALL